MGTAKLTPAGAGCWLDGAMGWHNTYRVVDLALELGWQPQDVSLVRHASEVYESQGVLHREPLTHPGDVEWASEVIHDMADDATDYLQTLAPEGYWFEWDCGELCLVTDDPEDDDA